MKKILLHIGETKKIVRSGGASNGYEWKCLVEGDLDTISISKESSSSSLDTIINNSIFHNTENSIYYKIKGLKIGEAIVTFYFVRSWESIDTAIKIDKFLIQIE